MNQPEHSSGIDAEDMFAPDDELVEGWESADLEWHWKVTP